MDWSKTSSIAEIVSSIAILVTLIFLVIQTQQNTAAIQASTRSSATPDLLLSQMEHPSMWAAMHKSEYTDEQKVYFNSYLVAFFIERETDWLNHQSGTLDDRDWRRSENAIRQNFTASMFRRWWNNFGAELYDPEFVALVDALMAESPPRTDNNILRTFD